MYPGLTIKSLLLNIRISLLLYKLKEMNLFHSALLSSCLSSTTTVLSEEDMTLYTILSDDRYAAHTT